MTSVGSIAIAMKNAVSSLQVTQSTLQVTSNNIANANNPDYTRKIANQESRTIMGAGAGVQLSSVTRVVDSFLIDELRDNTSYLGNYKELNNYFERMQNLFGTLNNDSSIARSISDISEALEDLAVTPEGLTQQLNVVRAASDFVRQINKMSVDLQDLRLRADREIYDAVTLINEQAAIVLSLNTQIARNIGSNYPTGELEDQRDAALIKIAEQIDITTFTRDTGEIVVLTTSGRTLVDREAVVLTHDPAASMNASITYADGGIGGITTSQGYDLTPDIVNGRIAALISVRDIKIPDLAAELNQLAVVLGDEINASHNLGSSFPPPNNLTGTQSFALNDVVAVTDASGKVSVNGSVRIAVLDSNGDYADDGSGNADYIDIDLAALTAASGGTLTFQNMLDAINSGTGVTGFSGLVGATASRSSTGNLVITATSASNGIAIDGTNIDGSLGTGATVDVSNVTIAAGDITAFPAATVTLSTNGISEAAGNIFTALLQNNNLNLNVETGVGTNPGEAYLSAQASLAFGAVGGGAGSSIGVAVNTASGDLDGGGTVEIAVDSTGDGLGDTVIGTITFGAITVDDPSTGGAQGYITIQNVDYTRNGVVNTADESFGFSHFFGMNDFFNTGMDYDSYISEPQVNSSYVPGAAGTLSITGAFGTTTVAYTATQTLSTIAQNITTALAAQNITASVVTEGTKVRLKVIDNDGDNFLMRDSSTLLSGLNFQRDNTTAAQVIAVRSSIDADASLVVRGQMATSATPASGDSALASGDNTVTLDMAGKFTSSVNFLSAGNQTNTNNTLSRYAASILGLNAIQASGANSELVFREALLQSLKTTQGEVSGVNIDEELAHMVVLQNIYSASARMISVTSELLDILINMTR